MANDKVFLPSSGAGLTRFDADTSKFHVSPITVMVVVGIIIVIGIVASL
ncbi:MAG TPA: hypothetical protein VJB87_03480 [Candidatus Nanoarchaeia archaeon]|nr:hypothetical protein [Candidatus Nanoarchaeia archaeon]